MFQKQKIAKNDIGSRNSWIAFILGPSVRRCGATDNGKPSHGPSCVINIHAPPYMTLFPIFPVRVEHVLYTDSTPTYTIDNVVISNTDRVCTRAGLGMRERARNHVLIVINL